MMGLCGRKKGTPGKGRLGQAGRGWGLEWGKEGALKGRLGDAARKMGEWPKNAPKPNVPAPSVEGRFPKDGGKRGPDRKNVQAAKKKSGNGEKGVGGETRKRGWRESSKGKKKKIRSPKKETDSKKKTKYLVD